jgi:hypothetical protein
MRITTLILFIFIIIVVVMIMMMILIKINKLKLPFSSLPPPDEFYGLVWAAVVLA